MTPTEFYIDDCFSQNDRSKKLVKCVGWDGIYFCEEHWMNYAINMYSPEEEDSVVEPFNISRSTLREGIEIKHGGLESHQKSNS